MKEQDTQIKKYQWYEQQKIGLDQILQQEASKRLNNHNQDQKGRKIDHGEEHKDDQDLSQRSIVNPQDMPSRSRNKTKEEIKQEDTGINDQQVVIDP